MIYTADLFRHPEERLPENDIKKLQKTMLRIAEDVIGVCEEEGIHYHLTGGTALGAVRHKGFIPWDDDFDMDIPEDEFDRFLSAFKERYGEKYIVHTCDTPGYGILTTRIRLKGTVCRAREDVSNGECGIFIDVFRIENTPDNVFVRFLHGILCMGMCFLLSCRNFYRYRNELGITGWLPKLKIGIGRLISFISVEKVAEFTQKCCALSKNPASEYVSVPAGRTRYFGELRKRSDFVETTDVEFEGHVWQIPKNWDQYLKGLYGNDYMTVPREREGHIIRELRFAEEEDSGTSRSYL